MPPKKPAKKTAANGYKMPDPIPAGEVVRSNTKETWTIGKSIGVGGFGEIYLCSAGEGKCNDNAALAMKIEPHENGPLFVEMNFYLRTAKRDMVEEFAKMKGYKSFGMPILRGSGNHMYKNQKYRFLVMDRYSKDLDKHFQGGKQIFSIKTGLTLAIRILDTLEYIHSKGYLHNDIKAQNLMLGYGNGKENDVYLVDFGLVSKYQRGEDSTHIEHKPDPRFAHDGTIEYLSRDAHTGVKSRRSDLEVLGYNLVHWLSGHLPWMNKLTNPKTVQSCKEEFMSNLSVNLQQCFGDKDYPVALKDFLDYVLKLKFQEKPNYDRCKSLFEKAISSKGYKIDGKLDFSSPTSKATKRTPIKRKSNGSTPASKSPKKNVRKSKDKDPTPKDIRKMQSLSIKKDIPLYKQYKESASQTSPNFVKYARAAHKAAKEARTAKVEMEEAKKQKVNKSKKAVVSPIEDVENNVPMDNPTPAMLELMRKKEAAKLQKSTSKRKPVLSKISSTSPKESKKYKVQK